MFCSELVRRRRRGYVNRSARLSAGEVGLNLLGRTRTNRIGPTRPTRVVYGPTDCHIPPWDRCMCPLAGAGRDVRACRSAGCWASRPARGARPMAPARTSWTARACHCLGCRQPRGLGWNISRIQRRCCHQNRCGILCRFYPHRTNSGRRAYFLIKNDRRE